MFVCLSCLPLQEESWHGYTGQLLLLLCARAWQGSSLQEFFHHMPQIAPQEKCPYWWRYNCYYYIYYTQHTRCFSFIKMPSTFSSIFFLLGWFWNKMFENCCDCAFSNTQRLWNGTLVRTFTAVVARQLSAVDKNYHCLSFGAYAFPGEAWRNAQSGFGMIVRLVSWRLGEGWFCNSCTSLWFISDLQSLTFCRGRVIWP